MKSNILPASIDEIALCDQRYIIILFTKHGIELQDKIYRYALIFQFQKWSVIETN